MAIDMRKHLGLLGMATPVWFLLVYLALASAHPEYSHLRKAVSELGSLDAPHRWLWNILGYIMPGLAIAALGMGLNMEFSARAKIPGFALVLSGLFMALTGIIPADMENRASMTTTVHLVGSAGSFLCFLVAGFWYPFVFRAYTRWRSLLWPTLLLVLLAIGLGFLRSGNMPGLGQRITFLCYFLWIALVGYRLYRAGQESR